MKKFGAKKLLNKAILKPVKVKQVQLLRSEKESSLFRAIDALNASEMKKLNKVL